MSDKSARPNFRTGCVGFALGQAMTTLLWVKDDLMRTVAVVWLLIVIVSCIAHFRGGNDE